MGPLRPLLVLAAVLTCTASTSCLAGQLSDCDATLVLDTLKETSSSKTDWRIAMLINDKNYSEVSKNADNNGEYYGIKAGTSYNEFSKNRAEKYREYNESFSADQSRNIAWQRLGDNATGLYAKCLETKVRLSRGLHLTFVDATKVDVVFILSYVGGGNDLRTLNLAWSPKIAGQIQSISFSPEGHMIRILRPTKELQIVVNDRGRSGYSDRIKVEPWASDVPPEKPKPNPCNWVSKLNFMNNWGDLAAGGPPPAGTPWNGESMLEVRRQNNWFYAAGGEGRVWNIALADLRPPPPPDAVLLPDVVGITAHDTNVFRLYAWRGDDTHLKVLAGSSLGNQTVENVGFNFRYLHQGQCPASSI